MLSPRLGTDEEGGPDTTVSSERNDSVLFSHAETNSISTPIQPPLRTAPSRDDFMGVQVEHSRDIVNDIGSDDNVTGLERKLSDMNWVRTSSIESETTTQLREQVIQQKTELETIRLQMNVLLQQVETRQQDAGPVGVQHNRSELDCSRTELESKGGSLSLSQRIIEEKSGVDDEMATIRQPVSTAGAKTVVHDLKASKDVEEMLPREQNVPAQVVEEKKGVITENVLVQESVTETQLWQHTRQVEVELDIKDVKRKRDIAMHRAKERNKKQDDMSQMASSHAILSHDTGKTVHGNSAQHSFIKFRAARNSAVPDTQVCAGCWSHWEGQEQSSLGRARLYKCEKCQVFVHSGCRSFFQRVFPSCPFSGSEPDWMEVNHSGHLKVAVQQVVQLDDMDPVKDNVFVLLRLLSGKDIIQTPPASWGEMGATWPALSDEEMMATDNGQRGKGGEDDVLSPLSLVYVSNGDSTLPLVLRIEVWRNRKSGSMAMTRRYGDELMGYAEVGISPLMAHPRTPERKWLQLEPSAAESNSVLSSHPLVLVNMAYIPEHLAHIPVPYSDMPLVSPNSIGPATFLTLSHRAGESSEEVVERSGGTVSIEYERRATISMIKPPSIASDHSKAFGNDLGLELPSEVSEICNDLPLVASTREVPGSATTSVYNEERTDADHHRSVQHLFRLNSYLGPTWCAYCKGVLFGFMNQGFQCELCGANVHRRCQVKANLVADCKGYFAVNNSGENGVQSEAAHVGEAVNRFRSAQSGSDGATTYSSLLKSGGVGLVQVHVQSAHLCTSTCSEWGHDLSDHSDNSMTTEMQRNGLIGDYYCRMRFGNVLNETQRTQTVFQSSAPTFNECLVLSAPAYDSLLELELVNSASEKVVGRWCATCFDLLQLDYDALFSRETMPSDMLRRLELVNDTSIAYATAVVRGFLVARVSFQEDTGDFFWGSDPRPVPNRECSKLNNDLSVELFSKAVRRVSRIMKWPKRWIDVVKHVLSWENPALSGIALIVLLYCSLFSSTEYILALPIFFFLVHMTLTLGARFSGRFVRTLSMSSAGGGALALPNSSEDGFFQPVAILKVAIIRGRNMLSTEMGLPGNAFVRLWYCPADVTNVAQITGGEGERNASIDDEESYSNLIEKGYNNAVSPQVHSRNRERGDVDDMVDDSISGQEQKGDEIKDTSKVGGVNSIDRDDETDDDYNLTDPPPGWIIGETTPYWLASSDPEWASSGELGTGRGRAVTQSRNIQKGDVFLQNVPYLWHTAPGQGDDDGHLAFVFPVLQPISSGGHLIPWSQYHGFLRFEAFLANPFNSIMDTLIGEVRIPLSYLVSKEDLGGGGQQPEVRGWYRLRDPAENNILRPPGEDLIEEWTSRDDSPALDLRMQITLRDEATPPTPDEKDASRAVCQLLSSRYNSSESQEGSRSKNPLTALFKLRNSISAVLRVVIKILDMAEALKNLLNWSHPYKSAVVYGMFMVAYILLLIVPSRVFLLIGGMAAFYAGLKNKLKRDMEEKTNGGTASGNLCEPLVKAADRKKAPLAIKLANLFATIPTDIELERAYLWRTRQSGSMALRSNAAMKSSSGLQESRNKMRTLGLGVHWQGTVFIHGKRSWERKFLVLQGHRLAWWKTATAVEEGKPAAGQLLLQGHSGLTDPSPMEMRLADNPNLLICAFGRGSSGQPARVSLLCYTYKVVPCCAIDY